MKYISQHSDRLRLAYHQIEELKAEITRLRKENAALRITSRQKERQKPATCSIKHNNLDDTKHYAQPTASSRLKEKIEIQQLKGDKDEPKRAVVISNSTYIYSDCMLLLVPSRTRPAGRWNNPSFLHATEASGSREFLILKEKLEKEKRARTNGAPQLTYTSMASPYDSRWGSYEDEAAQSPPTEETTPSCHTPLDIDEEDDKAAAVDLAQRSRLDEGLDPEIRPIRVLIDSKTGLDHLQKAAVIVQQAIYNVWKDQEPRHCFDDGPHLVRLGRNELMGWMGMQPMSYMAHNGHCARTVWRVLEDVVPLRNAISHPTGSDLRCADNLETLLRLAQNVTVVLGDEEGAVAVRAIRDSVRAEAATSLQFIKDLYRLAVLPFYGADLVGHQHHHVRMVKDALYRFKNHNCNAYDENYREEILAVAQAWDRQI
jgi:regulator of replication initiation timing